MASRKEWDRHIRRVIISAIPIVFGAVAMFTLGILHLMSDYTYATGIKIVTLATMLYTSLWSGASTYYRNRLKGNDRW